MTKSKCLLCGSLVTLSLLGFAPISRAVDKAQIAATPQLSLAKLQSSYKQAGSVAADFTQEVYQASLARTKTSQGSLKLSKPNFVRWETEAPEASVMVSDGRKVSYFTPDARGKGKGQVIERKAGELERQPIFRILTGSSPLDKEFTLEKQEDIAGVNPEAKITVVTLKPKKPMGDLERAKLKVNSKYLIEELILEAQSGNTTKITLQNQTLGAKLPGALFQFKAPPGTEVVKN